MSKPPKTIQIGPHVYTVKLRKHLSLPDRVGETTVPTGQIWLRSKMQSPSILRDTLLHELLHCIINNGAAKTAIDLSDADEEKLICAITSQLLMLIRYNPELIEFLTEGALDAQTSEAEENE